MSSSFRSPSSASTTLTLPSLSGSKPTSKRSNSRQALILYKEEHKSQHQDASTTMSELQSRLTALTAENAILLAYATQHSEEQWQQQQAEIDDLLQYKIKYVQLLSAERASRLLMSDNQHAVDAGMQQLQQQVQAATDKEVEAQKRYHLLKQQYEDLQSQHSTLQSTYKHQQQSSNELHASHQQLLTTHHMQGATITAMQLQHTTQQLETENVLRELKLYREQRETLQATVQRHEVAAMNDKHRHHELMEQIQRHVTRENLLKHSVIEAEQSPLLRAKITELEIECRLLKQNAEQLRVQNSLLLEKQKLHIQQSVAHFVTSAKTNNTVNSSPSDSVVEELQARLTQSLIDLSQAQQNATQHQHTMEQQQQQVQEIRAQLLQKEEKISSLQQQRQELSDGMQELNQKFTAARYKQTVVEDEFDIIKQKWSKAVTDKQQLESALGISNEQLTKSLAECSSLRHQLEEQQQQANAALAAEQLKRSVAEQETADVRTELESSQHQFTVLQSKYMNQQTDLHSSQQKVAQLTSQINLLEQTVQRLKVVERDGVANEMELKGRTGEVDKLNEQLHSLQQQSIQQQAMVESLEATLNTTKQQLLVQQAQNVKLQSQMRQLHTDQEQTLREKQSLAVQLKDLRDATAMQRTRSHDVL